MRCEQTGKNFLHEVTELTEKGVSLVIFEITSALTRAGTMTPDMQPDRAPGVECRVGAGLAPDAPHGPVREDFPHTVRQ